MFLGTFWPPPQNIPAPIEGFGEMSLENNGFQDNTSAFDKNYPVKTSSWDSGSLSSQTYTPPFSVHTCFCELL